LLKNALVDGLPAASPYATHGSSTIKFQRRAEKDGERRVAQCLHGIRLNLERFLMGKPTPCFWILAAFSMDIMSCYLCASIYIIRTTAQAERMDKQKVVDTCKQLALVEKD